MSFLDKYNNGQTLLVDKDLDWTSFDVVKKIKNIIKCKKVGHAGTLDPLATGLLIICTGRNTKKINDIENQDKVYTGEFILGKSTPSHDLETEFNSQKEFKNITTDRIKEVSKRFVGEQLSYTLWYFLFFLPHQMMSNLNLYLLRESGHYYIYLKNS